MDMLTTNRICELLSLASTGQFTIDGEFKGACRQAVQIIRKAEKIAEVAKSIVPSNPESEVR